MNTYYNTKKNKDETATVTGYIDVTDWILDVHKYWLSRHTNENVNDTTIEHTWEKP